MIVISQVEKIIARKEASKETVYNITTNLLVSSRISVNSLGYSKKRERVNERKKETGETKRKEKKETCTHTCRVLELTRLTDHECQLSTSAE